MPQRGFELLAITCLLVVLVLLVGLATLPGWWLVAPAAATVVLGGMLGRLVERGPLGSRVAGGAGDKGARGSFGRAAGLVVDLEKHQDVALARGRRVPVDAGA